MLSVHCVLPPHHWSIYLVFSGYTSFITIMLYWVFLTILGQIQSTKIILLKNKFYGFLWPSHPFPSYFTMSKKSQALGRFSPCLSCNTCSLKLLVCPCDVQMSQNKQQLLKNLNCKAIGIVWFSNSALIVTIKQCKIFFLFFFFFTIFFFFFFCNKWNLKLKQIK